MNNKAKVIAQIAIAILLFTLAVFALYFAIINVFVSSFSASIFGFLAIFSGLLGVAIWNSNLFEAVLYRTQKLLGIKEKESGYNPKPTYPSYVPIGEKISEEVISSQNQISGSKINNSKINNYTSNNVINYYSSEKKNDENKL